MTTYAIDFESYYDKKLLSASTHGVWNYLHTTDIYLVSIFGDDGFRFVGHPKDAPWSAIQDGVWLSHNRSFDLTAALALGVTPPKEWHCTADLASYLQFPRALAKVMGAVYGEVLSKETRDSLDGVKWEDVLDKEAVRQYALKDGEACLRIWQDHGHKWPAQERALSRHTTDMGVRGLCLDLPRLHAGIETLRQKLHEIRKLIPWEGPPTSPKELAAECRRLGIEPPITTAVKDPRFDRWLAANSERAPFVKGIGLYRSTNRLLNGLETMLQFQRDGVLHQPLLYCGAPHTGRWSGGVAEDKEKGFNLQNMLRASLWDVDQRAILIPRPGHTFLTADLSQIEMRVLALLTGNTEMLRQMATGMDVYEVHARTFKGYTDPAPLKKKDPALRQICKVENLGLQFGMSATRYRDVAASVGLQLTVRQAEDAVRAYRESSPKVVAFWNTLSNLIRNTSNGEVAVTMPSGRRIRYEDVVFDPTVGERGKPKGWTARFLRGGPRYRLHGPLLTENLTQAGARDCFADKILLAERAGLPVVHHAHDELTVEVPDDSIEEGTRELSRIMSLSPTWAPHLPLASEIVSGKHYAK